MLIQPAVETAARIRSKTMTTVNLLTINTQRGMREKGDLKVL